MWLKKLFEILKKLLKWRISIKETRAEHEIFVSLSSWHYMDVYVCVCLWRHAHNTHRYMGQVILLEWGGDFITVSSVLSCSPQEIRNYSRIFLDLGLLKWCGGNISLSWKKCIRCFFPGGGMEIWNALFLPSKPLGPTHIYHYSFQKLESLILNTNPYQLCSSQLWHLRALVPW